jgi:hypothetical protein
MNKLMIIPLGFMLILTIITVSYTGATYINSINNTTIPGADPQSFDIWGLQGALIILIAAIAVGTVAGISILGSGLSDTSQKMIFNSVLYVGLWAVLTVVTSTLVFGSGIVFLLLYVVFTIMFVIGFAGEINSSGDVA